MGVLTGTSVTGKVASEKLRLARILLWELREGPLGWTQLEKRLLRREGSSNKFRSLMAWMRRQGYIVKTGRPGSRAPYRLNPDKVEIREREVSIKI